MSQSQPPTKATKLGPERPDWDAAYYSPSWIAWIAKRVPIQRVQELGLYKHPHLKTMDGLKGDDLVPIDESCRVELWPGVDEKTKEVQKFALARLPCGQWLYWEGRKS